MPFASRGNALVTSSKFFTRVQLGLWSIDNKQRSRGFEMANRRNTFLQSDPAPQYLTHSTSVNNMIYGSMSNENGRLSSKDCADCGLLPPGRVSVDFTRDFHHQLACLS